MISNDIKMLAIRSKIGANFEYVALKEDELLLDKFVVQGMHFNYTFIYKFNLVSS